MPSKKQPTRTAAPAAAPDPAPAPPPMPEPETKAAETTQDTAPPPADPPPPGVPVVVSAITDLGRARLLPEAPEGHAERPDDVQFEPGTIEQFMDADGRTMRIVNVGGQAHKAPAPFIPEQPETEGA